MLIYQKKLQLIPASEKNRNGIICLLHRLNCICLLFYLFIASTKCRSNIEFAFSSRWSNALSQLKYNVWTLETKKTQQQETHFHQIFHCTLHLYLDAGDHWVARC